MTYPRVASFKTAAAFRAHLDRTRIPLELDDQLETPDASPLAQPIAVDGVVAGNRFCILPMEGWDGTPDGEPSELTRRRWRHFGVSGAKLIWGGEAVAVRHDGRANPNQLLMSTATQRSIAALRDDLLAAHRERFGVNADRDLSIGLQLTHSGRYARPNVYDRPEPRAAGPHPLLDRRFPNGVLNHPATHPSSCRELVDTPIALPVLADFIADDPQHRQLTDRKLAGQGRRHRTRGGEVATTGNRHRALGGALQPPGWEDRRPPERNAHGLDLAA